jgi:hypothetical protein
MSSLASVASDPNIEALTTGGSYFVSSFNRESEPTLTTPIDLLSLIKKTY